MATKELLPGIEVDECPPVAVFDSRSAISRARRRATLRDASQIIILTGVDWLFMHWPHAHIPSIDRSHSLVWVVAANVAVLAHVVFSRTFPRWTARRIASTWNLSERARFFQTR